MFVPVVCITCSCPIGDKATLFQYERAEAVKKILNERGTVPTQVAIDVGLQIDLSDILEKLDIINDCCRMHLTSAMLFSDYY